MRDDRIEVVAAVDREAGLRTRLADAYVRSAPGGIRLAYLLTGDRAVAEDLVQEAFVRFVGRLRFLRDPDAFEPYLRRTIVNLSKNHFRRRAVERAYLEREGPRIEDVSTDPDVASYDSLRSALMRLPLRQRTAIALRYYEDLPDVTIAEVLGCSQGTVRSNGSCPRPPRRGRSRRRSRRRRRTPFSPSVGSPDGAAAPDPPGSSAPRRRRGRAGLGRRCRS